MEVSAINSPVSGLAESLTSPFLQKKVTINSQTPETKPETPEQEVFSREFFNQRRFAKLRSTYSNIGTYNIKSQKDIIENSISGGYSPLEAVQMYKAARTYGLNGIGSTTGLERLNIYFNEV